jgi:hypothetical protein
MRYSTPKILLPLLCCTLIAVIECPQIPHAFGDANTDANNNAPADSPAPRPATQPENEPAADAPMRRWFARLADPDPKVRDQARIDLMGLSADNLPKLRQLIIEHQPILPAQACALHDIVTQCVLAGESYTAKNGEETTIAGNQAPYFLGVEWTNLLPDPDDSRLGVTIETRLPGFPSYRYLRTGDMILGILFDPNLSLLQEPNVPTHAYQELVDAIASHPDTQTITLLILRDGEQMQLAIRMAPRPSRTDRLNPNALNDFKSSRLDRADTYWQENFVPLLESRTEGEIAG